MQNLDSALEDIARVRGQLAASSRFQGFAPGIVALTGLLAFALATWQSVGQDTGLFVWILLAAVSALMIGTEAIVRARRLHRSMANRLVSITLERFLPTAVAGAIAGVVVLLQAPEHERLLPGLWQLLMGVGLYAVLGNLPRQMAWAALFYFAAGTISLLLSTQSGIATAWLMGLPFGVGQLLVAGILHFASAENVHG
jgi:lysylphosphatidylglycerol synthetase-like protein (DUF2156 family)